MDSYPQVVDWLYSQLANYQSQGTKAYKPGLDNIRQLLKALGDPHMSKNDSGRCFKSIHIAGTNGKGSTAHILAAMAIENGYKVGLFTSPHIKDFRERIKINGRVVSKTFVVDFINKNKLLIESLTPSFFEITTAMALVAFSEQNCDYAIIETGLGGRLDATNVLTPEISVITNIGLDHTEFLGHTLKEIAYEKAGIIKKKKPVVIGEILPDTQPIFEAKAEAEQAKIHRPESHIFELDLLGEYQQKNANLAWETLQVLKEKGHFFDDQKSQSALTRIVNLTNFTGRLTKIQSNPTIIVDASHNPEGIKTLWHEIKSIPHVKLHCIYGSSEDKNYTESMALFPKSATYYFTSFDSNRAVKPQILGEIAEELGLQYSMFLSPDLALDTAKSEAKTHDLILIFGSFYLLETII